MSNFFKIVPPPEYMIFLHACHDYVYFFGRLCGNKWMFADGPVKFCKRQAIKYGSDGKRLQPLQDKRAKLDTRIYPCGLSGWLNLNLDAALLAV